MFEALGAALYEANRAHRFFCDENAPPWSDVPTLYKQLWIDRAMAACFEDVNSYLDRLTEQRMSDGWTEGTRFDLEAKTDPHLGIRRYVELPEPAKRRLSISFRVGDAFTHKLTHWEEAEKIEYAARKLSGVWDDSAGLDKDYVSSSAFQESIRAKKWDDEMK